MEPLVSVIIPVYNVLPYLREALDSVINQTYRQLEILIVDDGSTDGSGAVCDEYRTDLRVTVVHQENRGLSAARNTGLDLMTGDYVAFLDSDDAFCPDMIEVLMGYIHRCHTDVAACGYDTIATDGCLQGARRKYSLVYAEDTVLSAREAFIDLLEGRYSFSVSNKVYHRQIWEGLRFPEGWVYEDVWIAPLVLEKCEQVAVVSRVLIHIRLRAGSITHTYSEANIRDQLRARDNFLAHAEPKRWLIPSESKQLFRERYLRSLILACAEMRREENDTRTERLTEELAVKIRRLADETGRMRQIRTRAAWWMYRHCPGAIPWTRALYQRLKSMVCHG